LKDERQVGKEAYLKVEVVGKGGIEIHALFELVKKVVVSRENEKKWEKGKKNKKKGKREKGKK